MKEKTHRNAPGLVATRERHRVWAAWRRDQRRIARNAPRGGWTVSFVKKFKGRWVAKFFRRGNELIVTDGYWALNPRYYRNGVRVL